MRPVLFEIAGITIYSYGVFTVLSYLAFGILLMVTAKRLIEPFDEALRVAAGMLGGALIGGRLGFVLLTLGDPWTLGRLLSFSGGFLYTTAVLGGVLGPIVVAWRRHRPIGTALDLITPPMLGAWAVGNVGCFLAGCCWGPLTTVPWAVRFFAEILPPEVRGLPVHPTQLYSLLSDVAVLALVFAWPGRPGTMFLRAVLALASIKLVLIVVGVGHGAAMLLIFPVLVAISLVLLFVLRTRPPAASPAS